MKKKSPIKVKRGSDNVFADLGFTDAETHLLKAQLVSRVQQAMDDQNLTQSAAAHLMGVSQPDVSRMLRGQFRDISVERIMRMLTKLGCEIDISIKARGRKARFAPIHLEAVPV